RRAFFTGALARVRGHVELGVKAWLVGPAREPARAAAAGGGRAYLERRRDELAAAQTMRERAGHAVHNAHRTLLAVAVAGVANRPQSRELTGRSDEMIFNAAYLVRSGDESFTRTFAQIARAAAEAGVEFELTGPWPPHNFVGDD